MYMLWIASSIQITLFASIDMIEIIGTIATQSLDEFGYLVFSGYQIRRCLIRPIRTVSPSVLHVSSVFFLDR